MTTQQELDQQFDDLRNLALVCFLNDLGVAAFLERDERGMSPLFHAAGLVTPGTNLIDGARCERVMAKLVRDARDAPRRDPGVAEAERELAHLCTPNGDAQ